MRRRPGAVHKSTSDLVDAKPAGRPFRLVGDKVIVGDVTVITDRRPKVYGALGKPYETKLFTPTRIYPRSRNKYDHKELERQRVLRSLAKEKFQ